MALEKAAGAQFSLVSAQNKHLSTYLIMCIYSFLCGLGWADHNPEKQHETPCDCKGLYI